MTQHPMSSSIPALLKCKITRYGAVQKKRMMARSCVRSLIGAGGKAPLLSSSSSSCFGWIAQRTRCLSTSGAQPQPLVELREYQIHPEHSVAYLEATSDAADLRKSLTPLRFFTLPETGGQLHTATHAYYYEGGHAERNEKRKAMTSSAEWNEYLKVCRPHMQSQKSTLFVEAPLVKEYDEVTGLRDDHMNNNHNYNNNINKEDKDCILEIRRYNLILGYDTVPQFLSLYGSGLPSKLSAVGTDPTTSLVTLLYAEVGRLNEVVEIWRHGNGTAAMEQSRVAARGATEWREAIAKIAPLAIEFTSTIHKPTGFSPLR